MVSGVSYASITSIERKRVEGGGLVPDGNGEGLDHEADDGTQTEALIAVGISLLQHFRKTGGHEFLLVHLVEITDDGEFHTAAEGLDEIAHEAGAVPPQGVDESDGGVQPAGQTLPLQGVVEEAVTVVQGHIQRMLGLAFLPDKEVLGGGLEIPRPKKAGVFGFQPEDAGKGVLPQAGQWRDGGIKDAEHEMLVLHLGIEEVRGELDRPPFRQAAEGGERGRIHIPALLRQTKRSPLPHPRIPPRHDDRTLTGQALQSTLAPAGAGGETLDATEGLNRYLVRAGNQKSLYQTQVRGFLQEQ